MKPLPLPAGIEPYFLDEEFGIALYCDDCLEILPLIEAGSVDAVVTDPPYGQNYRAPAPRKSPASTRGLNGNWVSSGRKCQESVFGDDAPFDPGCVLGIAPSILLWGAHRFSDRLPVGQWIVWDKREGLPPIDQGDGEAAWVNKEGPMRIHRHRWAGLIIESGTDESERQAGTTFAKGRLHTTQKPIGVMLWSLSFFPDANRILDPFAGSGTTLVACIRTGRRCIGIEISEAYCAIATKRIKRELQLARMNLFRNEPRPIERQAELFT